MTSRSEFTFSAHITLLTIFPFTFCFFALTLLLVSVGTVQLIRFIRLDRGERNGMRERRRRQLISSPPLHVSRRRGCYTLTPETINAGQYRHGVVSSRVKSHVLVQTCRPMRVCGLIIRFPIVFPMNPTVLVTVIGRVHKRECSYEPHFWYSHYSDGPCGH